MIYATEVVTDVTADDFESTLNDSIDQWQRGGHRVEVQFAAAATGSIARFSALIIAHSDTHE
jgi:hypothetical protein